MTPPEQRLRQRRDRHLHSRVVLALLCGMTSLFCCLGCGDEDWQAETYPAQGRITINGESPSGTVVELHSTGEQPDVRNSRPWAIVQEDGTYVLSTYETGDGAPVGDYKVVLRWPPDVTQPSLADRLGGAYSTPQRSPWMVNISEGDNELPPIELTGAKVLPKEKLTPPGGQGPPGPGPMMSRRGNGQR